MASPIREVTSGDLREQHDRVLGPALGAPEARIAELLRPHREADRGVGLGMERRHADADPHGGTCPVASEVVVIMPANCTADLGESMRQPFDLRAERDRARGARATHRPRRAGDRRRPPPRAVRPPASARPLVPGPGPTAQGIGLLGHQLEASQRLQRPSETGLGLVGPLLEAQDHRLGNVHDRPSSAPVLAARHDLSAARDVLARLSQASGLGAGAGEVGKHPHLEVARSAVLDDPTSAVRAPPRPARARRAGAARAPRGAVRPTRPSGSPSGGSSRGLEPRAPRLDPSFPPRGRSAAGANG